MQVRDRRPEARALVASCRRQRDRALVGDDPRAAADWSRTSVTTSSDVVGAPIDDVTDVEAGTPAARSAAMQFGLGGLGEQCELSGVDIHKHAAFFADDSVGQRQHLGTT